LATVRLRRSGVASDQQEQALAESIPDFMDTDHPLFLGIGERRLL